MKGFVMEQQTVQVKFGGEIDGVSVETFTQVLLGYSRALTATAAEIDPNLVVNVEITATRPGCLEAILRAVGDGLPGLLASIAQTSDQLKPAIETFHSYLELRRFLGKNGAPKEIEPSGDSFKIVAENGSHVTVNQYVMRASGSDTVDTATTSMFNALAQNEKIESLEIDRPAGAHFAAPRDEFETMRSAPRCELGSERTQMEKDVILAVTKPMLAVTDQRKWEFIWRGEKLTAFMGDLDFLGKLKDREVTFGIGDSIEADLELTQRKNEMGIWVNRKVRVVNVRGLQERAKDEKLF